MPQQLYIALIKHQIEQYGVPAVIKSELGKRGNSLRRLARSIGCNYETLKDVVHGRSTSARLLACLAEAIDLPKDFNFYKKGN